MADDGKTYHDVDHALRVRDAERKVIAAAEAFAGSLNASPMELLESVRALTAARQGA